MICGCDLGETFGFGAVRFVAAGAEHGRVELRRLNGRGIVGVPRLSSVAGFAGDDDMLPELFLIDDVGMAALANVVAGEGHGPGGDFSDGSSPEVSVLAETARDDEGAQADECNQCDCHDSREPDEVFDVLEQGVRHAPGASCAKIRNALGYLGFERVTMIQITGPRDGGHATVELGT